MRIKFLRCVASLALFAGTQNVLAEPVPTEPAYEALPAEETIVSAGPIAEPSPEMPVAVPLSDTFGNTYMTTPMPDTGIPTDSGTDSVVTPYMTAPTLDILGTDLACPTEPALLLSDENWTSYIRTFETWLSDGAVAMLRVDSCTPIVELSPLCTTETETLSDPAAEITEVVSPDDGTLPRETPIPDPVDECENDGVCTPVQDGLESLNPYPYSTPREPGTAGQAEELAASMMFVSPDSYTSGFLDPLWIFPSLDQLLAPRIVFRPWTIATSQRGFYSRGIYVYVPQGQSLQVLLVNGSNPPTPLVEAQSDGPFVRYPPPPAAEGAQIFRVGVSPMPPADTIPVLGPTPATRYRFAAAAGLTERRILLLRSGGMEAYLEMSPTALTQWTPAAPPAGGGGVVTAGPPPTYSNVPIARAVPNRPDAQRYADSPTLADIIVRHLGPPIGWNGRGPRPSRDPYICANPGTSGHETVHFINNYIYWEYGNRQGMYFGNGNGAAIREVTGNLNGVLALVPHSLRGSRVRTYFGSSRRDVTWLFDEANAYMLDAEIAIELRNYPNWDRSIAEGEGAGEFIGYSLATLMYIEQGLGQPRTLSEQDLTQMRNAVRLNIERAAAAFKRALEIRSSHPHLAGGRSDFLTRLRDDATAQGNALRAFAVRTYGQAWFNAIVDMTPSGTP